MNEWHLWQNNLLLYHCHLTHWKHQLYTLGIRNRNRYLWYYKCMENMVGVSCRLRCHRRLFGSSLPFDVFWESEWINFSFIGIQMRLKPWVQKWLSPIYRSFIGDDVKKSSSLLNRFSGHVEVILYELFLVSILIFITFNDLFQ